MLPQALPECTGKHDDAVLAAFTLSHDDGISREVDVFDP
jgi:hypothetical protein